MRVLAVFVLSILAGAVAAVAFADARWPDTGAVSPWPPPSGSPGLGSAPAQGGSGAGGLIPWSTPGSAPSIVPRRSTSAGPPVNLSGTWRGSGGELVDIQRDTARVWGTGDQYCMCIFMVHGDRLIAYSPDTDVVRKYRFYADRDRFLLRDEDGQTMWFQRVR
ncbi:MAG: hypothetical protein P8106_03270 [Gammaproteobacteria bacterium]|jgi:hypothetical protein